MDKLVRGMTVAVLIAFSAAGAGSLTPVGAAEGRRAGIETLGIDWDAVKRDWPRMSPIERAVWERIFADRTSRMKSAVPFSDPDGKRPDFPSEFCPSATLPAGGADLPLVTQNTTEDRFGLMDLSVSGACAGGGTQFSGTGLGPDLVYKIHVDTQCELRVTVRPEIEPEPDEEPPVEWDVALYIVREPVRSPDVEPEDRVLPCLEPADDCVRVSDGGGIGLPETIAFTASTAEDYYIVVDGYLGGSGIFELKIAEVGDTGCRLTRMTLDEFFGD